MVGSMPFKRKPRLPDFDYLGCHCYSGSFAMDIHTIM